MMKAKELKKIAEELQQGITQLGRNRAVALSPHQQWELTDRLEEKLHQMIDMLKGMDSRH